MELREFGPDDLDDVRAYVEVQNAVRAADAPWEHPLTEHEAVGHMRHGWDGDPDIPFLASVDGKAVAFAEYYSSRWDNQHVAGIEIGVHPAHRRQGHGTSLFDAMVDRARSEGRTTVLTGGWDLPATRAFAARHDLEEGMVAVNRRQFPAELDRDALARLYDETLPHAAEYDLVRLLGRSAEADLAGLAEMTAAINDAPIDDLDIEDEVFTPERIRAYEDAQLGRGHRLYRVFARHRDSGQWAGQTVVAVEAERPHLAGQHDTSVVRAHRGHRLGLLLKLDMLSWLAEAEPQVEQLDTWNAQSNDHMIDVNETRGYRVMGRGIEFQKKI
jgi:GNAT superfamily N-acetyltransferase